MLRKACEDLLPAAIVWRKKAQFDEGSGTLRALGRVLSENLGSPGPFDRAREEALYESLVRERYKRPALIFDNARKWAAERVATLVTAPGL